MANDFKAELQLANGMYLTVNFRSMLAFERLTGGTHMMEAVDKIDPVYPQLETLFNLYQACLSVKQPDLTEDEVMDIMEEYPNEIAAVIGMAMRALFEAKAARMAAEAKPAKKKRVTSRSQKP